MNEMTRHVAPAIRRGRAGELLFFHLCKPRTRGPRRRIVRVMVGHVPLPLKAQLPQNLIRGNVLTGEQDDKRFGTA